MTKKVFIYLYKTRKLLTSMEYINSWGQRNVRSSSEESSEGNVKLDTLKEKKREDFTAQSYRGNT